MWQRFTLYDARVVGHYLGVLLVFDAVIMVVPLVTAFVFGEWEPVTRYLLSIGITLTIGAAFMMLRIQPGKLQRRQALAVVGLAWIVLGMMNSLPLYLSGHYLTYLDAVFEGVSGLTTTGASVIMNLDHLSYADNMFRFMMHLLGGLGLIVVALSLGVFGRSTGSSLYTSEGRSEHVVPNVIQTTQFIARLTAVIILFATIVLFILFMIDGIEPLRALLQSFWVSISGFATGGFTPMQQSILYYHSIIVEFFLILLMLAGSISFAIYANVFKGNAQVFFKDIETRTIILWLILMAIVFTASLANSTLFSDTPSILRRGLFMIVSAATTTGFSTITANQLVTVLTSGAFLTLAILMAVGGGAGSTSGGIKLFRVGIITKSLVSTIKEAVSPDSARVVVSYFRLGRRILTPDVVKSAMTIFVLYVITYVTGALVCIAHGYDASQAIFESIAMTSNGGLTAGIASPGMPLTLELFFIFQMWVGRLEFLTLLAFIVQVVVSIVPRRRTVADRSQAR